MRRRPRIEDMTAFQKEALASPYSQWTDPSFVTGSGSFANPSQPASGSGDGLPWWANHAPQPVGQSSKPGMDPSQDGTAGSGRPGAGSFRGAGNDVRYGGGGASAGGYDPGHEQNANTSWELTGRDIGRGVGLLWDLGLGAGGSQVGNMVGNWLTPYDVFHHGPVTATQNTWTDSSGDPQFSVVPNAVVRDAGHVYGQYNQGQWGQDAMNGWARDQASYFDATQPDVFRNGGQAGNGAPINRGVPAVDSAWFYDY
jgi:hypothetical protein